MSPSDDDDKDINYTMSATSSLQDISESAEKPSDIPESTTPVADVVSSEDAPKPTRWQRLVEFYWKYEFLILVVVVILLAKAYPPLGAVYLAPQITATWIAVIFIFVLAGLGLRTSELTNAFQLLRFNVFVQTFNFGLISSTVFLVTRLLIEVGALEQSLGDGMVICSCLPMSINMVFILTKQAGGNEAAAVFNAAFGNMTGVFLSPVLILAYLGVLPGVEMGEVFFKLSLQVIVPIIIGQLLQKFSTSVVTFAKKHKSLFSAAQQYALLFIIYTVFCRTFNKQEDDRNIAGIFLCILYQLLLLIFFMILSWLILGRFFPKSPELRVMGLFGCTHKTIAMGVPMINTIYSSSPYLAQYILPLIVWYPLQLIIGSVLVPRLRAFVKRENERLQMEEADGEVADTNKVDRDEEVGDENSFPVETEQAESEQVSEAKEPNGKGNDVPLRIESVLTGSFQSKDA